MYRLEKTEKTENGLDWLIVDESGKWIAWTYTEDDGNKIIYALNSYKES